MKKPVRLIIAALLLVLLGAWMAYYISGTPEFSLYRSRKAAQSHNWKGFQKYVDVDNILDKSIEVLADLQMNPAQSDSGTSVNLGGLFAKGFMFLFKNDLKKVLKSEVRYFIDHGEFEKRKREEEVGSAVTLSDYWTTLDPEKSYKGRTRADISGDEAKVSFTFHPRGAAADITVWILMSHRDGYWKITDIQNMKEVIRALDKCREAAGSQVE